MAIFDPAQAFQAGQAMGSGQSSLPSFLSSLTDRLKSHMETRDKTRSLIESQVASKQALAPFELEQKRAELGLQGEKELEVARGKSKIEGETLQQILTRTGQIGGGGFEGATPTEFEYGGVKFSLPGKAKAEAAKRKAEITEDILTKSQSAIPILQKFEVLMGNLPSIKTPSQRIFGAPGRAIAGASQSDPSIYEYQSNLKSSRAPLARSLQEVGNLTEQEQNAAVSLLDVSNSTNEVRARSLSDFYSYVVERTAFHRQVDPVEIAQSFGLKYDPRTRRVTNSSIELIRRGKKVKIPSRTGGEFVEDPQTGKVGVMFEDGTVEEL